METKLTDKDRYGYYIIESEKDKKKFLPKKSKDEFFNGYGIWSNVFSGGYFDDTTIYRRKIPIPAGWRLVRLDEQVGNEDKVLSENNEWVDSYWNTLLTVKQCVGACQTIRAFIRKVNPENQPINNTNLKESEWLTMSQQPKDKNQPVWALYQTGTVEWKKSFNSISSLTAKWQPAPKPPFVPLKNEAELAWEEFEKTHEKRLLTVKDAFIAGYDYKELKKKILDF